MYTIIFIVNDSRTINDQTVKQCYDIYLCPILYTVQNLMFINSSHKLIGT